MVCGSILLLCFNISASLIQFFLPEPHVGIIYKAKIFTLAVIDSYELFLELNMDIWLILVGNTCCAVVPERLWHTVEFAGQPC